MWDAIDYFANVGSNIMAGVGEDLTELFFVAFSVASLAWFVVYVVFGCWLRWYVARRYSGAVQRMAPLAVSHAVFSILFINPYMLMFSIMMASEAKSVLVEVILNIVYLGLIPIMLDTLLTRWLPRGRLFHWLRWDAPVAPDLVALIIALLLSTVAFYLAGFTYMQW